MRLLQVERQVLKRSERAFFPFCSGVLCGLLCAPPWVHARVHAHVDMSTLELEQKMMKRSMRAHARDT